MSKDVIARLRTLGRGPRARIRELLRADPIEETPWALRYLGDLPVTTRNRDVVYLVAGLYCSYFTNPNDSPAPQGTLAKCLAMLIHRKDMFSLSKESSLEKRFLHLIDLQPAEMGPTLRSLLSVLKADNLEPNFERLLDDLRYWNDDKRRAWVRDFYLHLHKATAEDRKEGKDTPDETA